IPSMPGIRMSLTMTSGRSRLRRCSIVSPLSKDIGVIPACSSARSRTHRIERSSSTTHTLLFGMRLLQRQINAENRRARLRLALDESAVLPDDALCDRQPEAGAIGAPADHRVIHAVEQFRRDAWAVVGDLEAQHLAMTGRTDRELPDDARAETDLRCDRVFE